ncbi:PaaI family thioesterase [Microbacterium sp. A82]|uniref:PaaI family thioesterase n=1 Tax=Microbacterium sp. A82 TaxID=3450452 RepID=UPI003F2EA199
MSGPLPGAVGSATEAEAQPDVGDAELLAAKELATAVRALCDRVIRLPASARTARIAARIEELTAEMERHVRASEVPWYYDDPRTTRRVVDRMRRLGDGRDELSDFNPMMPPLRIRVENGRLAGRVLIGPAFTGPPGLVHGGTQATMLDHIMGMLVAGIGTPAVTGRIEVDYRRGAPIGAELELAAEIESIDGRKIRVRGTISHAGEVCAVGQALFIAVRPTAD